MRRPNCCARSGRWALAKSKVYGVPKLRRLLRRLPESTTEEIKKEIAASAQRLLVEMQGGAPNATTAAAMRVVIARDGLTARIGLIGKRANRKGFLARIFEFGAKPHMIEAGARRGRRRGAEPAKFLANKGEGKFFGKRVNHTGMSARPFFFRPAEQQRPAIIGRMRKSVERALVKASGGE